MPDLDDEERIEMSVPAEAEEEPLEVLYQNQLSSDQAHIMPQLFGWLGPDQQKERARYLTDVTRPRSTGRAKPQSGRAGVGDGLVTGLVPGEHREEEEMPTIGP